MAADAKTPEPKPRNDMRDVLVWGGIALAVLVFFTLPAALIAGIIYRFTPPLKRLERIIVVATCALGLLIDPRATFIEPMTWMAHLVGLGHGPLWVPPILGFMVMIGVYVAIIDTVLETHMGGKLRLRIRTTMKPANPFAKESVIPDAKEKAGIKIASVPGGSLTDRRAHHGVDDETPSFGKRTVAFAVDANGVPVSVGENELRMHGVILGSTGSGKTVTIKSLAASLLDLGWSGMILDLKEDLAPDGLRWFCGAYASNHALPYQQMALSDPNSPFWLNPLAGMDPDFARDTILSLTSFDDAYWQNINKKMLGQLVNLCYDAHAVDPVGVPYPTINGIGRILESGNLPASTKKMRALVLGANVGITEDRYAALASPDPDAQKSAAGFGAKLTQMYDTVAGRTVLSAGMGRGELDVTSQGLTYVGLDSTGKPDLAKLISSAVLQRMSVYAAQRTVGLMEASAPRFLIIDEASVVDRSILQALLSKARGAGVCVIVCTQGPDDWIDKNGNDWSMLVQNINVGIIMSQGSPQAAEMCAEFIGSKRQYSVTTRLDSGEATMGSASERIDYVVDPSEIRGLSIGEAVLRVSKPAERITWMKIIPRDPTIRA
jgi:hypothetical protein